MTALLRAEVFRQAIDSPPLMSEQPRHRDALTLVALPTALGSARSFVFSTLERWKAPLAIGEAAQLVEELVASSVETTGITDPHVKWSSIDHLEFLTVTLLGFRRSVAVEVWDADPFPSPQLSELNTADSQLQQTLKTTASRWGIAPSGRGKVVWAELGMYARAESGLPVRPRIPTPRKRELPAQRPHLDLLRRVRDGLENL